MSVIALLGAGGLDLGALLILVAVFCAVGAWLRLPVVLAGPTSHNGWELAPGDYLGSLYLTLVRVATAALVISAALLVALRSLWGV